MASGDGEEGEGVADTEFTVTESSFGAQGGGIKVDCGRSLADLVAARAINGLQ